MPGDATHSQGLQKVLKLRDFTAGMVADSTLVNINYSNHKTLRLPTPQLSGSLNCYGVMCLKNGGLLLGPTIQSWGSNAITVPGGSSATNLAVTGAYQDTASFGQDFALIMLSGINGTPKQVDMPLGGWAGYTSGTITLSNYYTNAGASFGGVGYTFPFRTIINLAGPIITDATCWTSGYGQATYTDGVYDASTGGVGTFYTGRGGLMIPANGRVWMVELSKYGAISYTDPALGTAANVTMGTQATNTHYDYPSSYGAWGMLSTGQQLLVKQNNEGGVIVTGDIFNPNSTVANAVQGTNGYVGQAAATPIGLVYFSQENGAFAWGGGASSSPLSTNIPAQFFQPFGGITPLGTYSLTPIGVNCYYMYNCIFFSGGMFYHIPTGSWWKLPPYFSSSSSTPYYPQFYTATNPFTTLVVGDFQTYWVGTPGTAGNLNSLNYSFDVGNRQDQMGAPPTGYFHSFYESNPLIIDSDNIVEVQGVDVIIQGNGTLSITCLGIGGATLATRTVDIGSQTSLKRISLNTSFTTDVLIVQLGWTAHLFANSPTPIIAEVDISYIERFPVQKS